MRSSLEEACGGGTSNCVCWNVLRGIRREEGGERKVLQDPPDTNDRETDKGIIEDEEQAEREASEGDKE